MGLKRGIFLLFASVHLGLILLYNAHSILTEHGYQLLKPYFQQVNQSSLLRQYLLWSGTETVYGFFAPSVGSQHILLLQTVKQEGNTDHEIGYPLFSTSEGMFRYVSFLAQLEDRLISKHTFTHAYGRTLLKGIINQYERCEKTKKTIALKLYVVIQPSLLHPMKPIRYKKIYHLSLN